MTDLLWPAEVASARNGTQRIPAVFARSMMQRSASFGLLQALRCCHSNIDLELVP